MFELPWSVEVEADALRVDALPLGFSRRRVPPGEVAEVLVAWWPPTVRLRSGEYLFVDARRAQALADFAERHGVPFVERTDVWALILEEFLDTELPPEAQEQTLARLEENGVTREETARLRTLVGPRMLEATALTWEWQHYGLCDVLSEMKGARFEAAGGFEAFRATACALADRGKVKPSTKAEFLRFFPKPGEAP